MKTKILVDRLTDGDHDRRPGGWLVLQAVCRIPAAVGNAVPFQIEQGIRKIADVTLFDRSGATEYANSLASHALEGMRHARVI